MLREKNIFSDLRMCPFKTCDVNCTYRGNKKKRSNFPGVDILVIFLILVAFVVLSCSAKLDLTL